MGVCGEHILWHFVLAKLVSSGTYSTGGHHFFKSNEKNRTIFGARQANFQGITEPLLHQRRTLAKTTLEWKPILYEKTPVRTLYLVDRRL